MLHAANGQRYMVFFVSSNEVLSRRMPIKERPLVALSCMIRQGSENGKNIEVLPVNPASIFCESCEREWPLTRTLSFFEKQSLESKPCPNCGACTLACHDDEEAVSATRKTFAWN